MRRILPLVAAFMVTTAAAASAATVPVTNLKGPFKATNTSVYMVADGVHFGLYSDAGQYSGSMRYDGLNGKQLKDVTDLSYTFVHGYRDSTVPGEYTSAPYLRIFLDTDGDDQVDTDVLLDPGYCATKGSLITRNAEHTFQMVGNDALRYDDDPCDSFDNVFSWDQIVAAHGNEKIVGIYVSQGWTLGLDVSAMLLRMTINGDSFEFGGIPGPAGPQGPQGPQGDPGTNGANGATGAQGPQGNTGATGANGATGAQGPQGNTGANGATGATGAQGPQGNTGATGATGATGLQGPKGDTGESGVGGSSTPQVCTGKSLRTLTVPRPKGWTLKSARATLRSKALPVSGNKISVDLRKQVIGNYNVTITATYTKAGKTRRVVSSRHLSIACR